MRRRERLTFGPSSRALQDMGQQVESEEQERVRAQRTAESLRKTGLANVYPDSLVFRHYLTTQANLVWLWVGWWDGQDRAPLAVVCGSGRRSSRGLALFLLLHHACTNNMALLDCHAHAALALRLPGTS